MRGTTTCCKRLCAKTVVHWTGYFLSVIACRITTMATIVRTAPYPKIVESAGSAQQASLAAKHIVVTSTTAPRVNYVTPTERNAKGTA